jgi:hypothetical protein
VCIPQRQPEFALEIGHAAVIGAELVFEGGPCDECGFPRVYAPQALRQPCVDIESKGAFFQRPKGFEIKRNGMFPKGVKTRKCTLCPSRANEHATSPLPVRFMALGCSQRLYRALLFKGSALVAASRQCGP